MTVQIHRAARRITGRVKQMVDLKHKFHQGEGRPNLAGLFCSSAGVEKCKQNMAGLLGAQFIYKQSGGGLCFIPFFSSNFGVTCNL